MSATDKTLSSGLIGQIRGLLWECFLEADSLGWLLSCNLSSFRASFTRWQRRILWLVEIGMALVLGMNYDLDCGGTLKNLFQWSFVARFAWVMFFNCMWNCVHKSCKKFWRCFPPICSHNVGTIQQISLQLSLRQLYIHHWFAISCPKTLPFELTRFLQKDCEAYVYFCFWFLTSHHVWELDL